MESIRSSYSLAKDLKGSHSYVYLIGAVGKIMKIGFTTNLARRLEELKSQTPLPLEVLNVVPGDMGLEYTLHEEFSYLRFQDEWFVWSDEIIERFREIELLGGDFRDGVIVPRSEGTDTPYQESLERALESFSQEEAKYTSKQVMGFLGLGKTRLSQYDRIVRESLPLIFHKPRGSNVYTNLSYAAVKKVRKLFKMGATEAQVREILKREGVDPNDA